jgi:sec-independent protein translocase protein TatA
MFRNGLEPWHLVVVLVVVFLLFGAKRLPDTARALGKSLRILKSETKALKEDFKEGAAEGDAQAAQTAARNTESDRPTIQAAPGDVASARPVDESHPTKG